MADINSRPNIRIEIKNNVTESMEVDEETINISEGEEGEISDNNEPEEVPKIDLTKPRDIWAKFDNGIATNTNNDAKNEIESIYTCLNVEEVRDTVRLDAVHMRGIGEMNTLDILKYFLDYSPTAIEWVDETSCNILWAEMPMAAKALYHLSKAIVGSKNDGTLEETMDLDGKNSGMQNKHRIIEIKDDDKDMKNETDKKNIKEILVRDIEEDIPEGNWRLGNESMKSKFILLRFALTTDKKPFRAEHFTEYYKQCGVIENGNKLGIISKSRKRKFQGIFDRNRDLASHEDSSETKNPWGPLAESWYQDYGHTEPEYKQSTVLSSQRLETISNLHHRLGFKRAHLDSQKDENNIDNLEETNDQENHEEVIEIRSDIEDTIASEEHTSRLLLEKRLKHKSPKKKKSKVPRMRMYADEEEAKIKRKKSLQSLKKKLSQNKKKNTEEVVVENVVESTDLRNMLGKRTILKPKRKIENMVLVLQQKPDDDEQNVGRQMEDLGNKLKHRHLMRLSQAAAKNSIHLRLHGVSTVSSSYPEEETYYVREPKPEPPRRPISTASTLIPRDATLHSDTIVATSTPARRSHHHTMSSEHRSSARSPERIQRTDFADRGERGHYHREGRHRDRDRSSRYEGGRMHADREEYQHDRRSRRRGEERRSHRRDVEEEEMERVDRKGTKSKVMVVVKKQHQPSVASMAILPRQAPSSTIATDAARLTSISTATLRANAHHRRHDNVRLATRESNRPSSSSSSSSDDDSSSSSSLTSSSSGDDSSSESGSESDSDDSSESDTSDSEVATAIVPKGGTVVRGGRGSVKDRVGIKRENTQQGKLRVQIKNEHYGK